MSFTHFRFRCMRREVLIIFLAVFILNLIWEELHSVLYLSYKEGDITHITLLRAALFDATVITLSAFPLILWESNSYSRCRSLTPTLLFVGALILFAILLEKWALGSGRWVYADAMPLIPFLGVGLTPTIQLGLLGYISLKISGLSNRTRC